MTDQDQVNFFDRQNSDRQPLLIEGAAASAPPTQRTFVYDGQYFSDPGAEYSVQDVLLFLAQDYPELENATYNSRTLPDGAAGAVEEITFVKVAGEKGADGITAGDIAVRLIKVAPAQLEATRLARQLLTGDPLTPEEIVAHPRVPLGF